MWKSLLLSIALAVSFSTTTALAYMCGDRNFAVRVLADKHGESKVATGMVNENYPTEIYTTIYGSTWTILLTGTDSRSCLVATDQNLKAGNLGKIHSFFTGDYTNLVAFGYFNDGRLLVVIANDNREWRMLSFGLSGIGMPMFQGKNWQTTTTDPEA